MIRLTEKKKKFCQEYIVDFNATRALIAAGYSKKGARQQASRLLTNVNIQNFISSLIKAREQRTEITQDRVLIEIARLAFNDPRKAFDNHDNLLPISEWPDEVAAAISSIKVSQVSAGNDSEYKVKEVKFWDKGRQLELAAKHLGMLKDITNFNINNQTVIQVPLVSEDDWEKRAQQSQDELTCGYL